MLEQQKLNYLMKKLLEEFDLYIPIVAENEYRAYYEITDGQRLRQKNIKNKQNGM